MRPISAWIFDLGAEIYGWFTAQSVWRASCARLADPLPLRAGLRILDLGCGPGVSTFELARLRPGALIIGLDIAPRMLREARRHLQNARRNGQLGTQSRIRWVIADVVQLPFVDASFDGVTGHSFLYLLPDQVGALSEAQRVLAADGRLVLMEPNARPASLRQVLELGRGLRYVVSVSLWRPFSRLHGRFTPTTLKETLYRAGFTDVEAEDTLGGLGVLASAARR